MLEYKKIKQQDAQGNIARKTCNQKTRLRKYYYFIIIITLSTHTLSLRQGFEEHSLPSLLLLYIYSVLLLLLYFFILKRHVET